MTDRGQMLLAMVMGAGKTPTTLAAIEHLFDNNEIDRVAIVVPSSLKFQWLREIKKFTNSKAIVIDGSKASRISLWRMARMCKYVIVNPEMLVNDEKEFLSLKCDAMVEWNSLENCHTGNCIWGSNP